MAASDCDKITINTAVSNSRFYGESASWNGVDVAIAGFGNVRAAKLGTDDSALELFQEQMGIDKTLLFNAGLDLGYIAAGAWMMERSKNVSKDPYLWKGYGKSIMLQGAFLFAFDVAMVLIHKKVVIGDFTNKEHWERSGFLPSTLPSTGGGPCDDAEAEPTSGSF